MIYKTIQKGTFLSRPNRFIAHVLLNGKEEVCHVKNTGRCKELLLPGAEVYVEVADNPDRKTKYDVIGVKKGDLLINMDSQAPNKVFYEWVRQSDFFPHVTLVKPECTYGRSRFDCYLEYDGKRAFVEVKGVTLEKDGVAMFPDAPTERGIKHVEELVRCIHDGYEAYLFFVVQMKGVHSFTPNRETHPAFADALVKAKKAGVKLYCVDCNVTENTLTMDAFVPISMEGV